MVSFNSNFIQNKINWEWELLRADSEDQGGENALKQVLSLNVLFNNFHWDAMISLLCEPFQAMISYYVGNV